MIIPCNEMYETFLKILLSRGVTQQNAEICADNLTQNSIDGIYSHGVNRFSRLIGNIDDGAVKGDVLPVCVHSFGSLERWDGQMGLGNVNAVMATGRACELAKEHGMGIVAMANTNHWMRGGSYGWQAANTDCVGMFWTNTRPNMPPWGGVESRLGNNPYVMSVPRGGGKHIVFDCAMSQFSYGRIDTAVINGEMLPVPGGWDSDGQITDDPKEIQKTRRVLPMGYWKGSGMSLLLDLTAALLSGGNTVTDIGNKFSDEIGLSQVFVAIDPTKFGDTKEAERIINTVIDDIRSATPINNDENIRYPGEREYKTRCHNKKHGIPVNDNIWANILSLK